MQRPVTSNRQESRWWPRRSRRSSGRQGSAIASTQKRGTFSMPSARSSNRAQTQRGWGRRRDTHSARACSRDARPSWSFCTIPEAKASQGGRTSLRLRSCPWDGPAPMLAGISVLVHNDGLCGRHGSVSSIRDDQWCLPMEYWSFWFHRVQRIPWKPRVGLRLILRLHRLVLSLRGRAPWSMRSHGCVSSKRPHFGRLLAWHALQGHPCARWMRCVRGETLTMRRPSRTTSSSRTVQEQLRTHGTPAAWRWISNAVENPSVMCLSPVIVKTTLGALVLRRRWGELTALFWALASSCSLTTRLHIDIFADSEHATGVIEGRTRAQHATGLVRRARDLLRQLRQLHQVLIHHVRGHTSVAGDEVADAIAERKDHFTFCEGCSMWISAATPGSSGGTEVWMSTSICDHVRAITSVRDPRPSVQTCGHVQSWRSHPWLVRPACLRRTLLPEERLDSTRAILRKVFRLTRDRVVMIDANGRLGEAPTPLLGNSCRPDFDDNGYSLLVFMHDWDMEARPLVSRFRCRHGHPEQARSTRSISSWSRRRGTTLSSGTQSSRGSHRTSGPEENRLVATQVHFQPKPTAAVVLPTFCSRDALRNPETLKKRQQFYDGVPAILPKPDAATAVELFSTLARNVLGSFAFSFCPGFRRPWTTEQTWAILQQLLEARRTRLATIRWCRRSLLCVAFSAWHRHKQDHRLRACDYHHQCALFDYRVAFATWNERYFGVAARRACRADYQAWLLEQTERISAWSVRSSVRGGDWSHDLCWLTR